MVVGGTCTAVLRTARGRGGGRSPSWPRAKTPLAYDTFLGPCPSFAAQWGHVGGLKSPASPVAPQSNSECPGWKPRDSRVQQRPPPPCAAVST